MSSALWWLTKDGDRDCLELYERHYSAYQYRDRRRRKLFVGPGEKFVFRTEHADACFVWRLFFDDCIDDRTGERQSGINCAVFRTQLLIASGLIAGITPTSTRKRSAQATLDFAFSKPDGGAVDGLKADS
jgi:hypothetical protein